MAGAEKYKNLRPMRPLKPGFDLLLKKFDVSFISPDPLECVRKLIGDGSAELEPAGLIAGALAYGRAEKIVETVDALFSIMGNRPGKFLSKYNHARDSKKFAKFVYRFNTGEDIALLMRGLSAVIREYGSLGALFTAGYDKSDKNIGPALANFVTMIKQHAVTGLNPSKQAVKGLDFLLSNPLDGSACKRMNLYLRWMVRKDSLDLGLWKKDIPASKLLFPLDTHVVRILNNFGVIQSNSGSWATAELATARFGELDPADPVKYDFAICSFGKLGYCEKRVKIEKCAKCDIRSLCGVVN